MRSVVINCKDSTLYWLHYSNREWQTCTVHLSYVHVLANLGTIVLFCSGTDWGTMFIIWYTSWQPWWVPHRLSHDGICCSWNPSWAEKAKFYHLNEDVWASLYLPRQWGRQLSEPVMLCLCLHWYTFTISTVDWKFFGGKIFHRLNFRLALFLSLGPLDHINLLHLYIEENISSV